MLLLFGEEKINPRVKRSGGRYLWCCFGPFATGNCVKALEVMKNAYTDILKNNVKKSASLALICHWVFQQDTRLKNNLKLVQNFSGQHQTLGLLKAQIYTLLRLNIHARKALNLHNWEKLAMKEWVAIPQRYPSLVRTYSCRRLLLERKVRFKGPLC